MLFRILGVILDIFRPKVLPSVLPSAFEEEFEKEISDRISRLKFFLEEEKKKHLVLLKELPTQLYNLLQSNTPKDNLLVVKLLENQLVWDKVRIIKMILLEILGIRENTQVQSSSNSNKRVSMFIGDLEVSFFMCAYDEGDVHEIIYEIELDIVIKKVSKEIYKLNYQANNLLGSQITEEIFIGFILENVSKFAPYIIKEIESEV